MCRANLLRPFHACIQQPGSLQQTWLPLALLHCLPVLSLDADCSCLLRLGPGSVSKAWALLAPENCWSAIPVGMTGQGSAADLEAALSVAAFGAASGEPVGLDQLWDMLDAAVHYREQVGRAFPLVSVARQHVCIGAGLANPVPEGPWTLSMRGYRSAAGGVCARGVSAGQASGCSLGLLTDETVLDLGTPTLCHAECLCMAAD